MSENSTQFFGYAEENHVYKHPLESIKAVAEFITREGRSSDVLITDTLDRSVCSTFGIFIDRCPDKQFLQELLRHLVPMQNEIF